MKPLPTQSLRTNLGTWGIPTSQLPALASRMTGLLPPEPFDLSFCGQELETTYFDTPNFDLRKARVNKDKYLTLRLRSYDNNDTFGLSVKTESIKFRNEIDQAVAEQLLEGGPIHPDTLAAYIPADAFMRLVDLVDDAMLFPVVCIYTTRYAVENDRDRLTLDTDITTHHGKHFHTSVLEWKSTHTDETPALSDLIAGLFSGLNPPKPIKLSKFLWATGN